MTTSNSSAAAGTPKSSKGGDRDTVDMAAPAYAERKLSDGTTVVAASMRLPAGWNRDQVTVEFVLPIPYPNAQPDCFYTDADLRLVGGAMPTNSGQQMLESEPRLWFSWHLAAWTPGVDNIHTYLRFIESRFRDAR
jgi:E2/UBC family protein E